MPKESILTLKDWIDQGAYWPTSVVLQPKKKEELVTDDTQLLQDVWTKIMATLEAKTEAEMKPYKIAIPGSDVSFEMIPIKGGEFTMGSPDGEKSRKPDEDKRTLENIGEDSPPIKKLINPDVGADVQSGVDEAIQPQHAAQTQRPGPAAECLEWRADQGSD